MTCAKTYNQRANERPLDWERGRLARTERRQARLISQKAQSSTCRSRRTSRSRFALAAGEPPALPVKRRLIRPWGLSFETVELLLREDTP